MRIVNLASIPFLALWVFVAVAKTAGPTENDSSKTSPLGRDWQCYKFPGDVELHRRLDKDGWLGSERRVEAGKPIYENVFHPDGTLHVENLYRGGILDRRIWHPAPSETSAGTYKPGQVTMIEFYKNNATEGDFFMNTAVSLERRFSRDGSYTDREFRNGGFYSDTAYSPGGMMLYRTIVNERRFEYFYDDGKLKKVLQTAGDKPETTYYDRRGKITTEDTVLRYDATLRFAEDNDAEASC